MTGYIFVCCVALASSGLLGDFVIQILKVVPLFQLASMEEESSWEYGCAWVCKAEGTTDVSHHLSVLL